MARGDTLLAAGVWVAFVALAMLLEFWGDTCLFLADVLPGRWSRRWSVRGVLLPRPDDPRWEKLNVDGRCGLHLGLGDIKVAQDPCRLPLQVGEATFAGLKAERYRRQVVLAYAQRVVIASSGNAPPPRRGLRVLQGGGTAALRGRRD